MARKFGPVAIFNILWNQGYIYIHRRTIINTGELSINHPFFVSSPCQRQILRPSRELFAFHRFYHRFTGCIGYICEGFYFTYTGTVLIVETEFSNGRFCTFHYFRFEARFFGIAADFYRVLLFATFVQPRFFENK